MNARFLHPITYEVLASEMRAELFNDDALVLLSRHAAPNTIQAMEWDPDALNDWLWDLWESIGELNQ